MPRTHANGVSLYYEIEGTGERLLLISGTGGDLRQQPRVQDSALPEHFEVLAYDQRGLGQSSVPVWPYAMADFANDAAALLDALGWDDCLVMGLSFGGMVAQEVAIRHPERVRRLVLACTSAGGAGGGSYPLQKLADMAPEERSALRMELIDTRWNEAWRQANPEMVTLLGERMGLDDSGEAAPGLTNQLAARADHDTSDRLGAIACPTFVCGGRFDGIAPPANVEFLARAIPGARLEMFDGGHGFFIQDPAAIPAIIAFLSEEHRRATHHRLPSMDLTATPEWKALAAHHEEISTRHLRELFADDPERTARMTAGAADLVLDYSKHRATDETLRLLFEVARVAKVEEHRDAMFAGVHINTTEDRAVLHIALRMPPGSHLEVDGQDVTGDVHAVLDKMGDLSDRIRNGSWTGATGKRIAAVVNIGIGGSDLGPGMATLALADYAQPGLTSRFVSNVDPVELYAATHDLDPETTLFVISSKTFTTLETLTNARAARDWLLAGLGSAAGDDAVAKHFVAVSTNTEGVAEFGIDTDNMLVFWDWVGGRYSYDSAIGFSLMVAIGRQAFGEMLAGFHAMDEHFKTAPLAENLPVIQGMLNVWYTNLFGAQTHAVLPYSHRLSRFPAYLQQLTMESNGKSVKLDGTPVEGQTGEIFWGEPGTNGQHAFYQLLHQGTKLVPADFIAFAESTHDTGDQQDLLMANCLAQTKALAFGKTTVEISAEGTPAAVVPHKVMPGNRPSSTILATKVTPSVLGQLVALYEHTAFVEGSVWGIDSFDQWGVELGKVMAVELAPSLTDTAAPDLSGQDSSTASLVRQYRGLRGRAV